MDNQKFGKFIKELRKKSNLTQKELGEKLNVTDKAVSKWERGLSFPDITIINTLADVFGITSSELLNAELGKKEEIDIDKVVKEAIEKYKNVEEKRRQKLLVLKKITIILSILFCILSGAVQLIYIVLAKPNGYEYVIDTMPYILNEIAIITGCTALGLLLKKSKIKTIIISSIATIITIINLAFLLNNGLDNECIVSISKDFKNELVLKKDKETGMTMYYRNVKFFLFAKPKEQLAYEVSGKIKYQWLEDDICSVIYRDRDKQLRAFVATYGVREGGTSSYYNIVTSIRGDWQFGNQYNNLVKLSVRDGEIKISENGKTEIFDTENCKQYGMIALVVYDEEIPRYVIGFNKDCKIDEKTNLIKKDGTITICEVSMQKTKSEIFSCTTYKNEDNLLNFDKPYVEKNSYSIKNDKLYVRYDDDNIIEVPGKFSNMKYNDYNYQISKEKTFFYFDYHDERYFVYSDDMGKNWQTVQGVTSSKIECIQFINSQVGYMLEFEDFVAGVASGKISKTVNGGKTWRPINYGIGEGYEKVFKSSSKIRFINENVGFLTMPELSGESSDLYITRDAGVTFSKLDVIISDIYDYYNLPTEENGIIYLKVSQGSDGDYNGGDFITYCSKDSGENWNVVEQKNK